MQKTVRGGTQELATFIIGSSLFGIDITHIQEINKITEITSVPQSEDYVRGVINLRGKIITLIDLCRKIGLDSARSASWDANIIVSVDDEFIGFTVEKICDVVTVFEDEIEPPPSNLGPAKASFLKGIVKTEKKLIAILDINSVLS